MRIPLFAAAFILLAGPAAAQQQPIGRRTQSPEAMVAQMRNVSPDEELAGLIAAAEAHPLGSAENPVRVGGPEGEHAYLGRLRCPDGAQPRIGARREAGVGAFGSVVAAYDVACAGAEGRIVFDMYHEEHIESRAPPGYSLAP
jgi:hypothetical protein